MSYDLQVFGTAPLDVDEVRAIAAVLSGSRVVGDDASGGLVVERKTHDGFDYAFNVDGPLRVDQEELPSAVVTDATGIRWT